MRTIAFFLYVSPASPYEFRKRDETPDRDGGTTRSNLALGSIPQSTDLSNHISQFLASIIGHMLLTKAP